jgi:S-formylglutathione hydrolase
MLSRSAPLGAVIALVLASAVSSQDTEGAMETVAITSSALSSNLIGDTATRTIMIYLPPGYHTSGLHYPVVYWLAGHDLSFSDPATQGAVHSTTRRQLDRMLDSGGQEMVTVFVDGYNPFGGSYYVSSSATGDWETFIAIELVEYIDATYRTIPHREGRGIDGASMGGYGSMHIALRHPEVFSVVSAQAGSYDWTEGWGVSESATWEGGATAEVDLEDWEDMRRLTFPQRAWFAQAAAFSPNPDRPPFFLDRPHQVVDGQARAVPEVRERFLELDIIHELDRYMAQPVRLGAMMIRHGAADDVVPVEQARSLVARLTELGIEHVYEEHPGGHGSSAEASNMFFSESLSFEVPSVVGRSTWGRVKSQY